MDSNANVKSEQRFLIPACQGSALACNMDPSGIEPLTSCLQSRRSPS